MKLVCIGTLFFQTSRDGRPDYVCPPWHIKFIYSEKATKILQNLPLTFDYSTYGQTLGEDFAKFCGLLRIYEL